VIGTRDDLDPVGIFAKWYALYNVEICREWYVGESLTGGSLKAINVVGEFAHKAIHLLACLRFVVQFADLDRHIEPGSSLYVAQGSALCQTISES